jgi:hypothetical protein
MLFLMIDFTFTFNGKSYEASATDVLTLTGDTHYHVALKDSDHQQYLKQPVLTKYMKGGYGWSTSQFVIETEFIKEAAVALIQKLRSK